jgi:hypothetical protein
MEKTKDNIAQEGKPQRSMSLSEMKEIKRYNKLEKTLQIRLGNYKIIKVYLWMVKNVVPKIEWQVLNMHRSLMKLQNQMISYRI